MKRLKSNFAQGLIWNYISLFFLAIGGVVFSFLIGYYYNAEVLGNFNLVYACYIVLSQVGVWGSHMAVTKYVSEYAEDTESVNAILSCAVTVALSSSLILGGIILFFYYIFSAFFFLNLSIRGIVSFLLAILFFSINKVILGYLNGLSKMKEYAVFQALRNIFIAMWIVIFALTGASGDRLSDCFFYTEIMLFLLAVPTIIIGSKFRICWKGSWIKKIIIFGTHIMPANIVLELTTKVDILCLSFVLQNDEIVGIYSFAALFAEGFYQLLVVIRRSINPLITQKFVGGSLKQYYDEIAVKVKKVGYLSGIASAVLVVSGYRILCLLMKDEMFLNGTVPLIIIIGAIICNMKSIILGNVLSQTGHPAEESVNNILTVAANFILNIILIYGMGMLGAALATGLSYFVFTINQKILVKKKLNLS